MIKISKIDKKFGEKRVLTDVSLEIKENALTSLIGENGAGKSTLFSIIANLEKPDFGNVTLFDKELSSYNSRELAKQISILKQTNNISIKISVRDLVEFGRFPHCGGRLKKDDIAEVDKAIDFLDLRDIQDRFIGTLSGGQRQRAFIAMILAQNTKYILLDEPLNNLDMRYASEMMLLLKRLVKELGKTVVIVMHDINCSSYFSDHIVAMKDGRIIKEGPPKDVIVKEVIDKLYDYDFELSMINEKCVCLYS